MPAVAHKDGNSTVSCTDGVRGSVCATDSFGSPIRWNWDTDTTQSRPRTRSSTNDFTPLPCMGWISHRPYGDEVRTPKMTVCCGLTTAGALTRRIHRAFIVASQRRGA
jgi:hypothetical protein